MTGEMRVLLVGKGAREHALAWKLSQTADHVYVVPGNGGTATMSDKVTNVAHTNMMDLPGLVQLAESLSIDLVIPGPDDVIVAGVADLFAQAGIPCFAPSKLAVEIEGSKVFAKDFMARHNIPTASYRHFDNYSEAAHYLSTITHRVVIKVSGLAAGKGVVLPLHKKDAQRQLHEIMVQQKFGPAGLEVVIEEYMEGDEISILTFSDGSAFRSLPPGQDHKRRFEGGKGPNTGGLGVYCPVDFVSGEDLEGIDREILGPTFRGMKEEGREFRGMLFTGIMMTKPGPKVIEYNARFGDPEAQSMITLLTDETDLAAVCLHCINGTLSDAYIGIKQGYACSVVAAAEGYPGIYPIGDKIDFDGNCAADVHIFHAGTQLVGSEIRTNGGRVLCAATVQPTLREAVDAAYEGLGSVWFKSKVWRIDIGSRCLDPSVAPSTANNLSKDADWDVFEVAWTENHD